MNEKEFAKLAAGAALHALSPAEERLFRSTLEEHPEWQGIVAQDAETAGLISAASAPAAPPASIRSALLAQIATTPQSGPQTDDAPTPPALGEDSAAATAVAGAGGAGAAEHPRRHWARSIFALAACLVLLVGLGIGAAALNGYLSRPASVVALEQIQAAEDAEQATVELEGGGTATAHWSAELGTAVLVTDGIAAPSSGEDYELWFVRGETPVSAGILPVDDGEGAAVLAGDMQEGDVIAVTVEEAGGSPTGKPTTDPVIAIPTA